MITRRMPTYLASVGLCCLPLFISQVALANGGAWTAKNGGIQLHQKGMKKQSGLLQSSSKIEGKTQITTVYWHYHLLNVAPVGLQVKLCSSIRCLLLPVGDGQTTFFSDADANASFYFSYFMPGRGVFYPKLQVVANQVTVNYRYQ